MAIRVTETMTHRATRIIIITCVYSRLQSPENSTLLGAKSHNFAAVKYPITLT